MPSGPDNPSDAAKKRPVLAVSMGDPLGIGPEIIVKALADEALRKRARCRVYGSGRAMCIAAERAGLAEYWTVARGDAFLGADDAVTLIDDVDAPIGPADAGLNAPGPSAAGGAASHRWVEAAIVAAKRDATDPGRADAIVTAPISKTSWTLAGHTRHPGHTELLAERFGAEHHAMLFVGPSLRVILVTIHVPLMEVGRMITTRGVLDAIELGAQSCREMGIARPRIAVCGLNPHAGEGGIVGTEDDAVIRPAVERAKAKGVEASGPLPADTLFLAAAARPHGKGLYDCVVAMYHDQGLIPMKLVDQEKAVNVTVGLPTVRTSPAHGTAFDIAGQDRANAGSMRAAIEMAIKLVHARRNAGLV